MASAQSILICGANRGLGLSLARSLLRLGGWQVLAAARPGAWAARAGSARDELSAAASTAARTPTRWGGGVSFLELDVASARSRSELAGPLAAALGASRLRALVICAGVTDTYKDGQSGWNAESLSHCLSVNAVGPLRLAAELAPFYAPTMTAGTPPPSHVLCLTTGLSRPSRVLSPGGIYARALAPGASVSPSDIENLPWLEKDPLLSASGFQLPAYSLSKAALNAGVRALASGPLRGLARVNAVDPGWCRTDMGGDLAPRSPAEGARSIYAALVTDAALSGTGSLFSRDGRRTTWAE